MTSHIIVCYLISCDNTEQVCGVEVLPFRSPAVRKSVMQEVAQKKRTIRVLMVEDNRMDVVLTREILAESERHSYEITEVTDGVEALKYLHRINGYENAPQPDLILLDLNLPKMNGFEVLPKIQLNSSLKTVPVCILTTSSTRSDIDKARRMNVGCYLIKPLDLEMLESHLSGIESLQ